jgi:predicted choloylglycine hydrolase
VGDKTFKDYTITSANPSTRTIGHRSCGLIFNFIDEKTPKKYSSRKELKILAGKFAEKNLPTEYASQFLLEVDRLKSRGRLQDSEILIRAYREILNVHFGKKPKPYVIQDETELP